ncbi:MAG: methionine biosynthesis protein MetW [Candidatus Omnitrophota bacterium]|nr:methionine biosynthesis protein MetW [Candidatus Omnitrophota bacterium]MDZ4241777.1 methionine biosynthesis protein MetW [Candidatus Omnitrophota bacterium]
MSDPLPDNIRPDHKLIIDMVEPGSKVLDLGCGNGDLLQLLIKHKNCRGTGIELDEKAVFNCLERGVSVSQGDLDNSMQDYSDKRFDYVILNESLQEVLNPEHVLKESARVGKKVIVGIPNFCNISARLQIALLGQVPVTKSLPYKWYNTPNLRFLSLKDFRNFCQERGITIEKERAVVGKTEIPFCKNLLAYVGVFLLKKE